MTESGIEFAQGVLPRLRRALACGALACALFAWAGLPAGAQQAVVPAADEAAPAASGAAELEGLVATIEDEAKRAALLAQLRALIAARRGVEAAPAEPETLGARMLALVSERMSTVRGEVAAAANAVLRLPRILDWFEEQADDPGARNWWIELLWKLGLVLVVSFVVERAARAALRRPRKSFEERAEEQLAVRIVYLLGRTVLDVIPIAVFAAAAYGLLLLVEPGDRVRLAGLALINANVIVRVAVAIARMVLAPEAPSLRVPPISDVNATYVFIWIRRMADILVYGYFLLEVALLLGLPGGTHGLLLKLLGLIVAAMLIIFLLQSRIGVADWIRGDQGSEQTGSGLRLLRRRVADVWHVLAVIYVAASYLVWLLDVPGGFEFLLRASVLSVAILLIAGLAIVGLSRAIDRRFRIGPEMKLRYPTLELRANRYLPALHLAARWFIYLVVATSLMEAWGIDVLALLATDAGLQASASFVTLAAIFVIALIVWEVTSVVVEHALKRVEEEHGAGADSARLRTLLPLLRKSLLVVLIVMLTFITLSELGLDIAPLLAGAGVVGLAIGFGAQTLVKDVITGIFILIENTIAVDDYVEVGTHAGTVESMSIRTIRLRDAGGNVHTVPFSDVTSVLNYTKEFAYAVLDIGVAYRESVDDVMAEIEKLGQELAADEAMQPHLLGAIEVQGVNSLADSAVVIRARIKTKAGMQWAVRREFNRRMKNRFDELGIEIPFPHQTIYFGEDRDGRAPPAPVRMVSGEADKPRPAAKPAAAAPSRTSASPDFDPGGDGAP